MTRSSLSKRYSEHDPSLAQGTPTLPGRDGCWLTIPLWKNGEYRSYLKEEELTEETGGANS